MECPGGGSIRAIPAPDSGRCLFLGLMRRRSLCLALALASGLVRRLPLGLTLCSALLFACGWALPAAAAPTQASADPHPPGREPAFPAITPSAPPDSVFLLDFETGSVSDWIPRPADRVHFKALEYRSDQALSGRRSLYCEVQGYDENTPPANEACLIAYRLARPVRMDSSSVVSWTWWFRDRETNDGISLGIWVLPIGSRVPYHIDWMSHSNRQRGRWPFEDPAGRPVTHRCSPYEQAQLGNNLDCPPPPWDLIGIDISLLFPTDQVLFIDDIRVGPPAGAPSPRAARTESSAMVPDPTLIRVADLDGDGRIDQFVGQGDAPPIIRLARPGGGLRTLDPVLAGVETARSLIDATFADLDQDGRLDLIALDERGLLLYRGLGGGEFRRMPSIRPPDLAPPEDVVTLSADQSIPKVPAGVLTADLLPGHGTELLLSRTVALQMDSIYVWVGPWRWKAYPLPPPCLGPPPPPLPIAGRYRHGAIASDVNGDHRLDLVLANIDLMVQTPSGLVCESTRWLPTYGTMQRDPVSGDVDNDGDLDLFLPVDLRHLPDSDDVAGLHSLLWMNEGDRFEDASDRIHAFDIRHVRSALLDDFDLDGDLELFYTQSARSRKLPLRPPNILLDNDGRGLFSEEAGLDSWLSEVPSADAVLSYDADQDGDPDLLILPRDGGPVHLCTNLGDGRSGITVRVLDRRGVPHAAGAAIALYEVAPAGARGRLVGYRQSGVGSVLPGCGEAIFGCPSAGPFELEVVWPSLPGRPAVRRGLRPGVRVTMIEPAFGSMFGGWTSWFDVGRRRGADLLSGSGWPIMVPLATLYGICVGVAGFAFRRLMPGRQGGTPRGRGWMSLRGRCAIFCGLAVMGALSLVIVRPVWPEHRAARLGTMLAEGSLVFGTCIGAAAAWLDSRRRDALRSRVVRAAEARMSLLSAIDGFSHAQWLKYLGGIAALTRSLCEGVEPDPVFARLRVRIDSYGVTIRPQMQEILRILPMAWLDPEVARTFQEDCSTIDGGVHAVRAMLAVTGNSGSTVGEAGGAGIGNVMIADPPAAAIGCGVSTDTLERMTAAVERLRETVQSIFRELGRDLRTDVPTAVSAAVDRVREELGGFEVGTDLAMNLPAVFAAPGDLANMLENLLVNGARAARANAGTRRPVVLVTAQRLGGLVTVSVRDSGAGIPAEMQPDLFFAKITDPDRHGRGLPYARRRLHHLDGDIRLLSSSPEGGTEFVVTLRVVAEG